MTWAVTFETSLKAYSLDNPVQKHKKHSTFKYMKWSGQLLVAVCEASSITVLLARDGRLEPTRVDSNKDHQSASEHNKRSSNPRHSQ